MEKEQLIFLFFFITHLYLGHWCYNKLFLGENAIYKSEKKRILFNQQERKEIIQNTDKGRELISRFEIARLMKRVIRKYLDPPLNKIDDFLKFLGF